MVNPLLRSFDVLVNEYGFNLPFIDDGFYFGTENLIKNDGIITFKALFDRFEQYKIIRSIGFKIIENRRLKTE